ncbi:MAG: TIM barrel protein [Lentisphaerae bacterium]|nr:TIM barrel protein [Lentisphaerota bacterium]
MNLPLCLSTRWNAHRHRAGEALIDEILALGFGGVELGYDLTLDLVPGVRSRVESGAVRVRSVHNFCPVPVGAPQGHPELFQLASLDPRERNAAVRHTEETAAFAAGLGAAAVVVHAGNVAMRRGTERLIDLIGKGRGLTPRCDRLKARLLARRQKRAPRHLEALCRALDELLPVFAEHRLRLALENLPSWESVPTEVEMETLLERYAGAPLAVWFDIGHAQVRENLGLISARHWFARFAPVMAGIHIHDVAPPAFDHLMPPLGAVDFTAFKDARPCDSVAVLEPAPATPEEEIVNARRAVEAAWRR